MSKEFLNEEMKPYSELTREEKHVLFDAHLDENVECCHEQQRWYPLYKTDGFNSLTIYRTKPKAYKKLDIPWQFIKPEFKYAAMDGGGDLYLYKYLPSWIEDAGVWHSEKNGYVHSNVLQIDTTDVIAQHSLTERPEGV